MTVDLADYVLNPADFAEVRRIGAGQFTAVSLVQRRAPPGERLARREWRNLSQQGNYLAEVEALCKIRPHPAICRGIGYVLNPPAVYCEYLSNGTLRDVLDAPSRPEWTALCKAKAVFGIASGMMHLHANNVVHRSLYPTNIMFDANWDVRIVDFAHARSLEDTSFSMLGGQTCYTPPEVHQAQEGGLQFTKKEMEKADIWAFGMILAEIITGRRPYAELNGDYLVAQAIVARKKPTLPNDDSLIVAICDNCLSAAPDDRPEFFHVVDAFRTNENPIFGVPPDQLEEYMTALIEATDTTEEARAVFNAPAEVLRASRIQAPAPPAFDDVIRAAEEGEASAQVRLGRAYAHGEGVATDLSRAYQYYRRAADQGNGIGLLNAGLYLMQGRGCPKDERLAAQFFKQSADQGLIRSQYEYAKLLLVGRGVRKDPALALKYFKAAADRGNRDAQYQYARMCYLGDEGVPKNAVEALKYYQLGHNAGDDNASCDYALMLVKGDVGVPKNPEQGARIYRQVAEKGCTPAWLNLGCLYDNERELNDKRKALECFQRAAAAGSSAGKVQLALYLKSGLGGAPLDLPRARQLLSEVADTPLKPGSRDMYVGRAASIVGGMCQGGEGGPVDIRSAFNYYGKASELGNPKAVVKYAELVVNGPGYLRKDPALAKQYLRTMIEKYRADPRLADDIRRAHDFLARLG